MVSLVNFVKHLRSNTNLNINIRSWKIEEKGETLHSFFYESSITLTPNLAKTLDKKLHTGIPCEHKYENLNKMLENKIQQYIKNIMHQNQVRLIPGIQMWLNIQKPVYNSPH